MRTDPNATIWFRGSASEPTVTQALPADMTMVREWQHTLHEAEPPKQCVPRQEPGNECFRGGDQREVSLFVRQKEAFNKRELSNKCCLHCDRRELSDLRSILRRQRQVVSVNDLLVGALAEYFLDAIGANTDDLGDLR